MPSKNSTYMLTSCTSDVSSSRIDTGIGRERSCAALPRHMKISCKVSFFWPYRTASLEQRNEKRKENSLEGFVEFVDIPQLNSRPRWHRALRSFFLIASVLEHPLRRYVVAMSLSRTSFTPCRVSQMKSHILGRKLQRNRCIGS